MTNSHEEWRRVAAFPMYEVSNLGRVRSWISHMGRPLPHLLKPGYTQNGYQQVSMRIPGDAPSRRTVAVHRVVAETFLGPRPGGAREVHVCHNNGDQTDNRVENLRYDTAKANVADSISHGTHSSLREARKTHCPHGHPYTEKNTQWQTGPGRKPSRACRACKRAADRRRPSRGKNA